jgi:ubiquilin
MSNVEAHPEGFNALRRMYENVQEPMMNAAESMHNPASSSSTTRSTGVSGPVDSSQQPSNEPLPNPWAPSSSTASATGGASTRPQGAAGPSATFNPFSGMMPPQQNGQMGAMNLQMAMQMLQNPLFRQLWSQISQNPELFEQVRQLSALLPLDTERFNALFGR